MGKDNVIIGEAPLNMGDRNTIINLRDINGNTLLQKSMAIGYGAVAGPNSIAIGSGAMAGMVRRNEDLLVDLKALEMIVDLTEDKEIKLKFKQFEFEIKQLKDKSKLKGLWELLKNVGSLNGMIGIGERFTKLIESIPN